MDSLKVQNNLLITRNNLLSTCCCDGTFYFEAIPCDAFYLPGEVCHRVADCVINDRRFVSPLVYCHDSNNALDTVNVCECQRLSFQLFDNLVENTTNAATLLLNGGFSDMVSTWTDTSVTITVTHISSMDVVSFSFDFSLYETVQELIDAINTWNPSGYGNPISLFALDILANSVPNIFENDIINISLAGDSVLLESKPSEIYLSYEGTTVNVVFSSSSSTFAESIQIRLATISRLEGIGVEEDEINPDTADKVFYIQFLDDLCGIDHDSIEVSWRLSTNGSFAGNPILSVGEYVNGWGQEGLDYTQVPNRYVNCPYEDPNYYDPADPTSYGYAIYADKLECCPQKGAVVNRPQVPSGRNIYGHDFRFLENTVPMTDGDSDQICFKVDPFFFLFGKEGRFDYNLQTNRKFINPNCTYTASGECGFDNLPTNCVAELFIPKFNNDLPWGPFGSYYSGIEDQAHKAVNYIDNGLIVNGNNIPANERYSGYNYAPSGMIRSFGTYTETTGISIQFYYNKIKPFYVGDPLVPVTDRVFGRITNIPPGVETNINYPIDTGDAIELVNGPLVELKWSTSGLTVGQFIDQVNQILSVDNSGMASCSVFNFCPAEASSVMHVPLNRINNLSTELYQSWSTFTGNQGASNPTGDAHGFSASTIYPCTKRYNEWMTAQPNVYNTTAVSKLAEQPPPCRRAVSLPQDSYDSQYRRYCSPYWTPLRGDIEDIVQLTKGTSIDPDARDITFSVSNKVVSIVVSSGLTILASTGLNTNRNGSGYTVGNLVEDINNLLFNKYSSVGTYHPVIATDVSDREIYLDNYAWWDGTGPTATGVGTPLGPFAYVEPLTNVASGSVWSQDRFLQSWLRMACTGNPSICYDGDLPLCAPPTAPQVNFPVTLNCQGDNFIDGDWLASYGCLSPNCITEWFVQAQRCGCNTAPACNEDGTLGVTSHPVNRSTTTDCTKLAQPTLYICEQNIHPECEVPFLIKVPYQYLCVEGQDCAFGNCYQEPDTFPCFNPQCPTDGPEAAFQLGYTIPSLGCSANIFDLAFMDDGYNGWCQYVDPTNLIKVRRRDIPRTWPPEAFVMERADRGFCTTNVNPFDLGSYPKYDVIGPLWPMVPYEMIIPIGENNAGWPCFMGNMVNNDLFAYIRPFVKNFNANEVCVDGTCGNMDIDCNTRCCYCGFNCNEGDPCDTIGPARGCTSTTSVSVNMESEGPVLCGYIRDPLDTGTFVCGYGPACDCFGPISFHVPCYDATIETTSSVNGSQSTVVQNIAGYTLDLSNNCVAVYTATTCCHSEGSIIETTEFGGGCSGPCFEGGCGPIPEGGCRNSEFPCSTVTETSITCATDLGSFIYEGNSSGITGGSAPCSNPCASFNPICSPITLNFSETFEFIDSNNTINDCGVGTISFERGSEVVQEGSPTVPHSCVDIYPQLGIYFGGGGYLRPECSCGGWNDPFVYQGRSTVTHVGSFTVTSPSCSDCDFDNVPPWNYEEVIGKGVVGWATGYYNDTSTSGDLYEGGFSEI